MADGEPVTAEELAERTGTVGRVPRGRGWPTRRPAATSSTTPETGPFSMTPEQALALAVEDSPAFFAGSMQLALGRAARRAGHRGAVPHRRRVRLARARRRPVRRAPSGSSGPATSPTWCPSGCPPSTASSTSSTGGRRRRRRRLRSRRLDDPDGRRRSRRSTFLGIDYHEALDRGGPAAGAERPASRTGSRSRSPTPATCRPGRTTWSRCSTACTTWATPTRGRAAARRALRARRHADGRRTDGRRPRRGQPEPGRPGLLRRLDPDLHPVLAGPARRRAPSAPRPVRPCSPRCCATPASAGSGSPPVPGQPRPRGPALTRHTHGPTPTTKETLS